MRRKFSAFDGKTCHLEDEVRGQWEFDLASQEEGVQASLRLFLNRVLHVFGVDVSKNVSDALVKSVIHSLN